MNPTRARSPVAAKGFRIGSIFRFEIRVDPSWFVIFFLVLWSLAESVFPGQYPGLDTATYLAMGLSGTLLFFASLLAHELSHALVSRRKGIPVEGITLFIFGGMALTRREPDSPKDEVLIAGIGPLASLVLAGMFEGFSRVAPSLGLGVPVAGVANYLAFINAALAIFNLMPGFPMDGGRVFRAVAWSMTGNREKATRWAVTGGQAFGTTLMVLGGLQALSGSALGGLWLVFIGWFLRGLAGNSLQQQLLGHMLSQYVAADLMSPGPEVVSASTPIASLVRDRFMSLRYGSYPVVDEGELRGLVTLEGVKRVPQAEWEARTVADIMTPLDDCAVVGPSTTLEGTLHEMNGAGAPGRALVVEHGRLVGIISASDIARWLHRLQLMKSLVERTA